MPSDAKSAGARTLTLSQAEATELLQLLEHWMGETQAELHHTHTPAFREAVQHRKALLSGIVEKLR